MTLTETQALDAFGALSQETRLQMVRALVVAGPDGMAAGAVADRVGTSSSGASFHLANLDATSSGTPLSPGGVLMYATNAPHCVFLRASASFQLSLNFVQQLQPRMHALLLVDNLQNAPTP